MKLKRLSILVGVDVIFLVSLYFFLLFVIDKLRDLMYEVQNYTAELGSLEEIMSRNMSMVDYEKLSLVTGNLKDLMSGILFYFFVGAIGMYLLYCLFQGANWNLAYSFLKRKAKVDYKYVLRFSLVSIIFLTVGTFLFYHVLVSARYFLLSDFIKVSFVPGDMFKLVAYSILWLLLVYFSFIYYAMLNKHTIGNVVKNILEHLKVKTFLYFLLSFAGIVGVIYLFLQLQIQSVAVYLVQVVLISFIIEKYRIYLLRNT